MLNDKQTTAENKTVTNYTFTNVSATDIIDRLLKQGNITSSEALIILKEISHAPSVPYIPYEPFPNIPEFPWRQVWC